MTAASPGHVVITGASGGLGAAIARRNAAAGATLGLIARRAQELDRIDATEAPEDEQAFRDVFDINVIGMVNTFQPYIAPMRSRGGGVLVGIASVAGYRGLP